MKHRAQALAAAAWAWWLLLGTWPAPFAAQAVALAAAAAAVLFSTRGKIFWPSDKAERIRLASVSLLILNVFVWRAWGLTPRLSFLTAPPILWTAGRLAEKAMSRGRVLGRLDTHRKIIAGTFLGGFTLWFAGGGILRFLAMDAEYWDLGSIGQAMINLARGRGFVSTDPAGFSDSRFAQHSELLFAALSPLLTWRFGVEAMIVLQAACVAAAAAITGLAMEKLLRSGAAFWAGLLGVGLSAPACFPLWRDFHGDVFAMLPLSVLSWALASGRRAPAWAALAASAACSEYALVASCGLGLMLAWPGRGDAEEKRRGLLLAAVSAAVFAVEVFFIMPRFRSAAAPSVLAIHLEAFQGMDAARALGLVFNKFHFANLAQILSPLSEAVLLSPAAIVGVFPNLVKDMIFGLDVSTHHFAPALPVLLVGLAWGLKASLPEGERAGALARICVCALAAGALWGPVPIGKQGWKPLRWWASQLPDPLSKAHQLAAASDPARNRLVTGKLGGILFDASALAFLGSTAVDGSAYAGMGNPEVTLELWDQGFPSWAPLQRMRDQLEAFLRGRGPRPKGPAAWSEIACGTLRLDDKPPAGPRFALTDGLADSLWKPVMQDDSLAYAAVLLLPGAWPIPLGLRVPGRSWLFFQVRAPANAVLPDRRATLQLRARRFSNAGMAAIKLWKVIAEMPAPLLLQSGSASSASTADLPMVAGMDTVPAVSLPVRGL